MGICWGGWEVEELSLSLLEKTAPWPSFQSGFLVLVQVKGVEEFQSGRLFSVVLKSRGLRAFLSTWPVPWVVGGGVDDDAIA